MEVKDWYKEVKNTNKKDKSFKNHEIEPNSIIGLIGQSGSGKSTALIDFISRCPEKFTEIHLFSGSGSASTEPLYKLLKQKIPELETYDNVEEIPPLESFEDKTSEKLIIFDDFLQLTPRQMNKLAQYATAGRKSGFTCIFMSQNYTSIPKVISRNFHYLWLFKIQDTVSVDTIYKNHVNGITKQQFRDLHRAITSQPRSFLMLDLRKNELRKNFLQKINTQSALQSGTKESEAPLKKPLLRRGRPNPNLEKPFGSALESGFRT